MRVPSLDRKIPWRREWQPTPVFLPGESHEGAWRAMVHGVTKSWTRLSDLACLCPPRKVQTLGISLIH